MGYKFNVGDKVVVVSPEVVGQYGGFTEGMSKYKGKVFTILARNIRNSSHGEKYGYHFNEDTEYIWDERCLELFTSVSKGVSKYYLIERKINEIKLRREELGYKW